MRESGCKRETDTEQNTMSLEYTTAFLFPYTLPRISAAGKHNQNSQVIVRLFGLGYCALAHLHVCWER